MNRPKVTVFDLIAAHARPPVPLIDGQPDITGLPTDTIVSHGHDYMTRHYLVGSPHGMSARYHHILTSDEDPHLHDHPWDFISVILAGSYVELTPDSETEYGPGSVLPRQAEQAHRLTLTKPVWTFVITSPARRRWGFHTDDGWTPWQTYLGQAARAW